MLRAGGMRAMGGRATHPAIEWARSGAMALTGRPDEAPRLAPGPIASWLGAELDALRRLAPGAPLEELGAALLRERAARLGLWRRGTVAPGGACRLFEVADGWIAATLARPDDLALLPAWLGVEGAEDPWPAVARALRERGAEEAVAAARLLGLAAAVARPLAEPAPPPHRRAARGPRPPRRTASRRAVRGARAAPARRPASSTSRRSGRGRSARISSASPGRASRRSRAPRAPTARAPGTPGSSTS